MSIGERLRLLDERVLGPPKHKPWRREQRVGLASAGIAFGTYSTGHGLAAEEPAQWCFGVLVCAGATGYLVTIARRTAAVRRRVFVVVATLSFVIGVATVVLVADPATPYAPGLSRAIGAAMLLAGQLLGLLAREKPSDGGGDGW